MYVRTWTDLLGKYPGRDVLKVLPLYDEWSSWMIARVTESNHVTGGINHECLWAFDTSRQAVLALAVWSNE